MATDQQQRDPPRVWVTNPARAGLFGWLFRYVALLVFAAIVASALVGRLAFRYFASELPDLELVATYRDQAPAVTRIYSAEGALLAELEREHRAYVQIEDVPPALIAAFLAAEDRRFYGHNGLDMRGLARAARANIQSGTVVQGGSTITQQVAKSFLADQERTLERKVREAILSLRMESRIGKDIILEIYLNKIFLGHGAYGVGAAASRYFDKRLDELTIAESAMIAGLAQAPSRWSPVANPTLAKRRRDEVLGDMVEAGYLDPERAALAKAEQISLTKLRDPFRWRAPFYAEHVRQIVGERFGDDAVLSEGLEIETAANMSLQAAADYALERAVRKLDRRHGWRGPEASVFSSADQLRLQERMIQEYGPAPLSGPRRWILGLVTAIDRYEATVDLGSKSAVLPLRGASWAAPYDARSGKNSATLSDLSDALQLGDVIWVRPQLTPEGDPVAPTAEGLALVELGQTPQVEGALFSYDHERAAVEAMAAGADYDRSQYNRATQACRPPGSVFKAFYYALALDMGWQMDAVLEAKPWEPEPGETWNPRNIDKTVDGRVLLRTALIKSLNTPSIRLFLAVGIDKVVAFVERLGFTTTMIPDKGLSLGASCVHIDELSAAFSVFARGGSQRLPSFVRRVIDKHGNLRVDERHPFDGAVDVAGRVDRMAALASDPPEQILDERTNFLISRLLREVVTSGTGTRATTIGAPSAGKSGTSSGRYRRAGRVDDLTTDAWFVGFTSAHVTAAWMGFDDRGERSLGDEEASYTTAIPMWTRYMKAAVGDREHGRIPGEPPHGISSKVIDATQGGDPLPGMPTATIYYRNDHRDANLAPTALPETLPQP